VEALIGLPNRVTNVFPGICVPTVEDYLVGVASVSNIVASRLQPAVEVDANILVYEFNHDAWVILPSAQRVEDVASHR